MALTISVIVCAHNEARYCRLACIDLFSVTSLKHYPYVANSDFHKPKHLYSWKTLLRCEKTWPAIKDALRSNAEVALMLFRKGAWAE